MLDPVKKKIIGVGSGEEEDSSVLDPVKKKTRTGGGRSQPEETVCSGNGRIERRSVQTVNGSRRLSTVKDG